jgi:nitrate/TMAO reductase-like tetraheme cytochrome c subunit
MRIAMPVNRWLAICAFIAGGGVVGAGAIITSTEINRRTSTDALCTSCHSMATLAADPHFQQSGHKANAAGVRVGCSDCHIPPGNWFVETYAHVSSGLRDVVAEYTHNFDDPVVWQKRRAELAAEVHDQMRRNDSITCRKCHDVAAIRPASDAGRSEHAMLQQGGVTCIDCHSNIVHAPARPSP